MRTDDLIAALAADTSPVVRAAPQRALLLSAAVGAPIALALVLAWLGLRPDLAAALGGGFFWIKAAYTAALATAFAFAAERLARPGLMPRAALAAGGGIVALVVALGVGQLLMIDPAERVAALKGGSWTVCTRNILALGAPMTLISLLALRRLAPTFPVLAGAAAGLFSGGVTATVYGLHCPEATFAFVGLWYTAGVACCGLLGAALGRWMLRW